jgi:hypothetical protein
MRTVRPLLRALGALTAVLLSVPALLLAAPSARASAGAARQPSIGIAITGMTPTYATAGSTVKVAGTLANHTGSAVTGITVQAATSPVLFSSRSAMTSFAAAGSGSSGLYQAGSDLVTGTVRNGQTVRWQVTFPAAQFYDQFGVYPVQVEASTPGGTHTAYARTLLPYWPGGDTATQPKKLQTAWVWPLVDTPQQGACTQTLATNELAGSVAGGGRLSTLLDAGAAYTTSDDLTWDIDPALLSDVSVMKSKYSVKGGADCSGRLSKPADKTAAAWLTQLQTATAGQSAFLTPYANVDAAALSHAGLDQTVLRSAYQLGEMVGDQILPATFGADATGTSDGGALKAAWPADGLADAEVLSSLATNGGISTVILSSGQLPSASGDFDNALARTTSGIGTPVSVLMADSGITTLLGSASAQPSQSGEFAFAQDFVAQTAMIASEAPALSRALVIAPPTGWDPSQAEAEALLRDAHDAPWLQATGLGTLATEASKVPASSLKAIQVSHKELPTAYVDSIRQVNDGVSLFTNLLYQPSALQVSTLQAAVATTASSAWRGKVAYSTTPAMTNLSDYLRDSERKVQIIASKKVLLAGASGKTPVSVKNGLSVPVQVHVTATTPIGSQLQVGPFTGLLRVQAGKTNTAWMPVHAATIGTTTVQLQLVTQDGSPLAWTAQSLSVEVTRFGRSLLIIIGGALGILVLTSVYRLRRKRLAAATHQGSADDTGNAGGAG